MAHEIAAAGGGFIWPSLAFMSDGELVHAECRPSNPHTQEPLQYVTEFDEIFPATAFENELDRFVDLVLERLSGNPAGQALLGVWGDVRAERADPEAEQYRRLEASLGFDPDEAPEELMRRLLDLSSEVGSDAVREIAAFCAGSEEQAANKLTSVIELPRNGDFLSGSVATEIPTNLISENARAHDRGRKAANWMRGQAGIPNDRKVEDAALGELLGLSGKQIEGLSVRSGPRPPLALAVGGDDGQFRFFFRSGRASGRRFEAARMLFDGAAQRRGAWHPVTSADTSRQKAQRAFAAELLAPISAIQNYLSNDYSSDAIEGAAEYFDVSSYTISSQLANHRIISRNHPAVPPQ
jgi:hypothetical protein